MRLRVKDKDGATNDYLRTLSADNVAPSATFALSTTGPVHEGDVGLSVAFTNIADPSPADTVDGFRFSYDLDGDGVFETENSATSSMPVSFASRGQATMRGRVTDRDGGTTEYVLQIPVLNVPPQIVAFTGAATGNEGSAISFSGSVADPGSTSLTASAVVKPTATPNVPGITIPVIIASDKTFRFQYVFENDEQGGYDVTLSVSDGVATSQQALHVTINNVPALAIAQNNVTLALGRNFSRQLFFSDPGKDNWTVRADFGAGGGWQTVTVDQVNRSFVLNHLYVAAGSYPVKVEIADGIDVTLLTFQVSIVPNSPPVVVRPLQDLTVSQGYTLSSSFADLTQVFADVDGPIAELSFSISSNSNSNLVAATIVNGQLYLDLNTNLSGSAIISVRATDLSGGSVVATFSVIVQPSTLKVAGVTFDISQVKIQFSSALDVTQLNLYDGVDISSDAGDLTLVGSTSGPVRGSVIWDATTRTLTFIKTGGPLAPDTYTLRLMSRADGFRLSSGELLDGDANGTAGGDYVSTFSIAPSAARVVSVPDFARGATTTAGQIVNLSYNNSLGGIPISINDAGDVLAVDFDLVFDRSLLDVSSAFVNVLPAGWSTAVNVVSDGRVRISLSGTTTLSSGPRELTRILASIPVTAAYGAVQIVRIENLKLFTLAGGAIPVPAVADAGLHKAIFVGDTNADGRYSAQDAGWTSSVVVQATSGYDAYNLIDPVVIADVNQNGTLDGLDAAWISRKGLADGLQPEIPNLPAGSLTLFGGKDPTIAADLRVPGVAGQIVQVPLRITDDAAGLWGVDITIDYDTSRLDLLSGLDRSDVLLAGMFATESGWTINSLTDDGAGRAKLSIYRATPSTSTQGQIASVSMAIKPTAPAGETAIVLSGYSDVPPFSFTHVSGSILVQAAGPFDISLSAASIVENLASGTSIGTLSGQSTDAGSTFVYTLVSGAGSSGNSHFLIDNSGQLKNAHALDFETGANYSIRVRATDQGGLFVEKTFTIAVVDVPEMIGGAVIGDGTSQRSLVGQVVATFDSAVTIDAGAFTMRKRGAAGGIVTTTATQTIDSAGRSVVTLTFSGSFTRGITNALQDGYYQLTIDGSKIRRAGQQLDLNADGIGGDTYTLGAAEADNFFAQYGDTNGDGIVGVAEFGQFRSAFGKTANQPGFNENFDYEGDGTIGVSDFGQFRARFGKTKPLFE